MYYESNISSVMVDLIKKLEVLKPAVREKCTKEIASDLMFSNKRRVYTDGNDVEGGKIGEYSTKPTLIGAKSFINKGAVSRVFGKKNNKKWQWRTIDGKRLAILPGGYKQIRKIEGKETAFVNLSRTKKMMKDLTFGKVGGVWCIGFPAKYNSQLSYKDMVGGFREKYGKLIWGVSTDDQKIIDAVCERYLTLR